jgi:Electron transfer DM13
MHRRVRPVGSRWQAFDPPRHGGGWRLGDDGRYVELGKLKDARGEQVYPIASDVDVTAYRSVRIWCKRFCVSFGAAELR